MSDHHIDFNTLVEEGVDILPAIVQIYGPYLDIINDYFVSLAVYNQETHAGLPDEQKVKLMNLGMENIQMNL